VVSVLVELSTRSNDCPEYEFRLIAQAFSFNGFPEPKWYALIHGDGDMNLSYFAKTGRSNGMLSLRKKE